MIIKNHDLYEMANTTNVSSLSPAVGPDFILALKVAAGTTCILSVLGASLIILTYGLFKDLRTTARQLLVNLSVADILVAGSHFVGLFTNFERFLPEYNPHWSGQTTDALCSVQAAVTMCGSIASFLWTMALAFYMFVVIVKRRPNLAKKLVYAFYPLCWGIPIAMTIGFGVAGFLGFEDSADVGWCYLRLISKNSTNSSNQDEYNHAISILVQVLGYDAWVYAAFIILPLLYIAIHCHIRFKLMKVNGRTALSMQTRAKTVDLKLIFVPLIFLLLRVWSAIIDVPQFNLSNADRDKFRETKANAAFVLLSGIGDNAQGLANAILFCVFTKQVRQKLLNVVCCGHRSRNNVRTSRHRVPQPPTAEEDTTYFENSAILADSEYTEHFRSALLDFSSETAVSEEDSYGTFTRSLSCSRSVQAPNRTESSDKKTFS